MPSSVGRNPAKPKTAACHTPPVEAMDTLLGAIILADFAFRFWIEKSKRQFFFRIATWADMAAMISFLAPIAGEGFGFLRILRTLRLLHTYELLARLRQDFSYFRRHEDVLLATVNLFVFLFVVGALVSALRAVGGIRRLLATRSA